MSEQHDVLESTKSWLGKVEVGEGRHFRNLTVFPLLVSEEGEAAKPRYELLSDAIEAGAASVEEVDEAGSVPFLAVANKAAIPVLVPEGEILIGAKQNRTVNLTVLVAAGATFKLPVSCVEQGRWSYASRHFKPAAFAHPKLRNLKMKAAQESRAFGYGPRSDQGAVWEEVEDHLLAMDAGESQTRSWTDGYKAAEGRLEDYRKAIELPARACGFLAARGGQVVGLDLFDRPETLRKLWRGPVFNSRESSRPSPACAAPVSNSPCERTLELLPGGGSKLCRCRSEGQLGKQSAASVLKKPRAAALPRCRRTANHAL